MSKIGSKIWGSKDVDVFTQDQTTPPIEYFLTQLVNAVTITTAQAETDNTIILQAGHGVLEGELIEIYSEETLGSGEVFKRFIQVRVVDVATNTIRIGQFIGFALDPANIVFSNRVTDDLNVLGSLASPKRFRMGPPNGFKWDLTRLMVAMILDSLPDDGLFGNVAQLTNGIFFGFEGDESKNYLVNIFANAGFRSTAYDVNYATRSVPAGSYGLSVRKTFAGRDKYGVAIRLFGETNDEFVMYVQDDLTDLVEFKIKIMGHIVED
jgi:hypothetical protein